MSEIKVSELPQASQLNDADLVMIVQGNANKKITAATFNTANDTRLDTAESNITTLQGINNMSSSEQVIGKWINNKPLYRKVIDIGSLPNATAKTVSTGITINSTHCIITKLTGIASYSNGITLPLPFISETSGASIVVNINNSNQLEVTSGSDRSSATGIIILEYYKYTDSAT